MANPPDYGFTSAEPAPAPSSQSNGLAVAGLVLGIVAAVLFWVPFLNIVLAILGIVFGGVGMSKAKSTGKNKGMAIAGLILGVIAFIASIALFVWAFFIARTEMDRELRRHRNLDGMVVPAQQSPVEAGDPCVYTIGEHG